MTADLPPDLTAVVTAWPDLSEADRGGIVAIVEAGAGNAGTGDTTPDVPGGGT